MNPPIVLMLLLVATAAAMVAVVVRARRRRADPGPRLPADGSAPPTPEPTGDGSVPHPALLATVAAPSITPSTAPAAVAPLHGGRIRTLTDMLEGIRLPYDLMPVTSVVEDPDRHTVFLTTHSNAGEVGKRFADELERLGYELESVDFDQAVAVRGDDVVSMKIVPEADRVEIAESPRYGAAGPGDVALETWVGRSPVPPSSPE